MFMEGFEANFHNDFREMLGEIGGIWGDIGAKLGWKALKDAILQ